MTPKAPPPPPPAAPLKHWIAYAEKRLDMARLEFGNGLQKPLWEAEYLAAHCLDVDVNDLGPARLRQPFPPQAQERFLAALARRIDQRLPMPYVTGEAFFAGLAFQVDPRVLIPRSLIENILDDEEGPSALLVPGAHVERILDLGTGSGCLAIAFALAFPAAQVDAADLSGEALQVATANIRRHGLEKRVHPVQSDLFTALKGRRYDLIVTNPPYVPLPEMARLPEEYRREPVLALAAGEDGLDVVRPLLAQAPDHLTPEGVLLCEVGDLVEETMRRVWPELPVTWLEFHFGGGGVFVAVREDLADWAAAEQSD